MAIILNGFEMAGTTIDRPDNVEAGQPYFNTDDGVWQVYTGTAWQDAADVASGDITAGSITGGDNDLQITGQTQLTTVDGGAVTIAGAASIAGGSGAGGAASLTGGASVSNDDGGAASVTGGLAAGVGTGGAASLAGGDGDGASNGAGGPASVTGGLGTGSTDGGDVNTTGGSAGGTGNGGAVTATTGAGGTGTTATGGDSGSLAISTGAAGTATTGDAGASGSIGITTAVGGATSGAAGDAGDAGGITLTAGNGGADAEGGSGTGGDGGTVSIAAGDGGVGATAGIAGIIRLDSTTVARKQGAPATVTTAATLTPAQMLSGIITGSDTDGSTVEIQLPTGTAMDAALPVDFGADDAFEIVIINLSPDEIADTYTLTENTGTGDFTIVGPAIIASSHADAETNAATFRCRKTAANTFVAYRVS